MNQDTKLLLSKLKRNRISTKVEGQKIIIGKAKFNYAIFFGLVVLPASVGFFLFFFLFLDSDLVASNFIKIIFGILFFMGTSLFYLKRLGIRYQSNKSIKTLHNSQLKIDNYTLDKNNIENIYFDILEEKEVFEGRFYILNKNGVEHFILQMEGNEQYLKDDLNWFLNYLIKYLR